MSEFILPTLYYNLAENTRFAAEEVFLDKTKSIMKYKYRRKGSCLEETIPMDTNLSQMKGKESTTRQKQ